MLRVGILAAITGVTTAFNAQLGNKQISPKPHGCTGAYFNGIKCENGKEYDDLDAYSLEYLMGDALTPDKVNKESRDDMQCRYYGMDRYRSESMYDAIDRCDNTIRKLEERRTTDANRLKTRVQRASSRWKNNN